jgi:chromosome segregation ATPase
MAREEIERRLALAQKRREEAGDRLDRTKERLIELDQERNAILGEAELAERALADFDHVIEESREALTRLELEEARAAVAEAVQRRDRAIHAAATALEDAVEQLQQVDAHRAAVVEAGARLSSLEPSNGARRSFPPEEQDILNEPWERMVAAVKSRVENELATDIVEAAARSHSTSAISALPVHLRELAMQRRREIQRAKLDRLTDAGQRTS